MTSKGEMEAATAMMNKNHRLEGELADARAFLGRKNPDFESEPEQITLYASPDKDYLVRELEDTGRVHVDTQGPGAQISTLNSSAVNAEWHNYTLTDPTVVTSTGVVLEGTDSIIEFIEELKEE